MKTVFHNLSGARPVDSDDSTPNVAAHPGPAVPIPDSDFDSDSIFASATIGGQLDSLASTLWHGLEDTQEEDQDGGETVKGEPEEITYTQDEDGETPDQEGDPAASSPSPSPPPAPAVPTSSTTIRYLTVLEPTHRHEHTIFLLLPPFTTVDSLSLFHDTTPQGQSLRASIPSTRFICLDIFSAAGCSSTPSELDDELPTSTVTKGINLLHTFFAMESNLISIDNLVLWAYGHSATIGLLAIITWAQLPSLKAFVGFDVSLPADLSELILDKATPNPDSQDGYSCWGGQLDEGFSDADADARLPEDNNYWMFYDSNWTSLVKTLRGEFNIARLTDDFLEAETLLSFQETYIRLVTGSKNQPCGLSKMKSLSTATRCLRNMGADVQQWWFEDEEIEDNMGILARFLECALTDAPHRNVDVRRMVAAVEGWEEI